MTDEELVARCQDLARATAERGNPPFGSLIVRNGEVVAEGQNTVNEDLDPGAHAEMAAIRNACRALGRVDLSDCTLYTSCEPCWLCSTTIRLSRISRVVFGSRLPAIGGYTTPWSILGMENPARFGPVPEVVTDVLAERTRALFAEVGWPHG